MRGWVIRIAIIAAIVVGGLVLRDRLSGSASDLKVGDCFDEPQGVSTVEDVQHHPCTESHTSEVVYVGDIPGDNAKYPTEADFTAFARANCVPAFNAWTGTDIATETDLDMGYFFPLAEGWAKGDHALTCYIVRSDGSAVSASFKKAP